jgi:hypothetical protein
MVGGRRIRTKNKQTQPKQSLYSDKRITTCAKVLRGKKCSADAEGSTHSCSLPRVNIKSLLKAPGNPALESSICQVSWLHHLCKGNPTRTPTTYEQITPKPKVLAPTNTHFNPNSPKASQTENIQK